MQTGKLWGYNKFQVKASPEFESNTVSNPSREWFWHIIATGLDTQAAQCYARITITYYAEMYQRTLVGSS